MAAAGPPGATRPTLPARLALAAAAALLALLLGEAALRLAGISYPNFYRPDPDRGWALRPGAEGWWRQEGLAYVRVSSAGLRDVEHPIPKPAGRLRIAVLGDSCAEALQVPVGQTFWKLLERRLPGCPAAAGRAVEALDFGVAGYGTAQELLTFRAAAGSRLRQTAAGRALYGAYDHLRVLQLAKQGKRVVDGWIGAAKARRQEHGEAMEELGLDSAVYSPPRDREWADAWRVTEAMIAAMRDEAAAHGARFGVVLLTTGIQVHPDPAVRAAFLRKLGLADLFYPDRRLAAFGQRAGMPVLDLAPPMQRLAARDRVFFHGAANTAPGEGHWNAQGHATAARLIDDWLCREVLGAPGQAPQAR